MATVQQKFEELFGKKPLVASSPGRVNLIGEHTDYNEGFVLPAAIDKRMCAAIAANGTDTLNLYANEFGEHFSVKLHEIKPEKTEGWQAYALGVVYNLLQKGCRVQGVDVVMDGNVPVGAGMSSSAALTSAFGFALNELFGLGQSRLDLAYIGQKTEHIFAGALVGIMDQFASLHGKAGHVMKLDCRSMHYEYIPFHFPQHKIVMVNSMVKHALGDSEYNTRRRECEEGVAIMNKFLPGKIKSLRDVPYEQLQEHRNDMNETVYNRCLYVVTENARLLQGCGLLEHGDLQGFGELMYQTHLGLSKQYEVSCPELDFLAEQAYTYEGVTGTRMMGGGFGGCTINLVEEPAVESFSRFIKEQYQQAFGKDPDVYVTQIEDGARLEE